mgnify:CR=1 FL=1
MNSQINKIFVQEVLENLLSQIGMFYIANKANKKKMKDFFNSMPFFFMNNKEQNLLYECIKNNNFTSYLDRNSDMKQLCYNIYKEFSLKYNVSFKSYEEFYSNIKFKLYSDKYYIHKIKKNNIHTIILLLFIITLIVIYYIIIKKKII